MTSTDLTSLLGRDHGLNGSGSGSSYGYDPSYGYGSGDGSGYGPSYGYDSGSGPSYGYGSGDGFGYCTVPEHLDMLP